MATASGPSLWLAEVPRARPGLEGDREADFAVIGAGYTGLHAALELRRRGAGVVVLEREYAGYGASGRNAGHLTPTIGKDLPTLLAMYGRERGGRLVRLAERAVEHVEATLADLGIDASYRPHGNVVGGIHDGHRRRLRKAYEAGRELGAALEWLEPEELDERRLPRFLTCGYLEAGGGVLDPGRYVRGLRGAALEAGVELFERSGVEALEPGDPIVVETATGRVSAGAAILATNAYTPELGVLRSRMVPLQVSLVATEPLEPEVRDEIGWGGEEGIYTAHEILESHRLTADGRIVSGSRWVSYAYRGRPRPDRDPARRARLERLLRERFPELGATAVERHWSGPIGFTLDFLPALGRTGSSPNLHHAVAYAGHGVAMASLLGTLVARQALDGDADIPELTERRRLPLPPEPLRWLLARGLTGALGLVDRRSDRRAARR